MFGFFFLDINHYFILKEKGLMTDSTQNFTVMSKSKIELLVLWKDVRKYKYILMNI